SSLTELMAASTSISSMVNCLHPLDLVYDHYRTGFQNEILIPVSESDAFKIMIRPHARRSYKKPAASSLWLRWMSLETSRNLFNNQKNAEKPCQALLLFFS
ncbi:MAG: hypothetical protein ABFS39_08890, partial [Pseudomonadota bacterium]